ncbi:MAG: sensor histidine kinase [Polyangiales bacterium]
MNQAQAAASTADVARRRDAPAGVAPPPTHRDASGDGASPRARLRAWLRTGLLDPDAAAPEDLAAFRVETEGAARRSLTWMTALLSLFNLAFWLTDAWVFRALPGVAETLSQGRALLVGVSVATLLALCVPRVRAYPLGFAAGCAVCVITAKTLGDLGGPGTPWFHFLHAYLLAPALAWFLPGTRALCTAAIAAVCALGYFGPHPAYLRDPFASTTLAHFGYVATMSFAVGCFADSLRLRFFLSQRALAAEREALSGRVEVASAALRRLVRHLDAVQEHERTRVARELHDELGQGMTALRIVLKTARDRHARDAVSIGPNLEQLTALLQQLTDDTRRLVSDMRPRVLDDLGLGPALDWLAARTTDHGVPCAVRHDDDLSHLPPTVASAAFRCAQEALTNVLKHARASRAELRVSVEGGTLTLRVADDGDGITPREGGEQGLGIVGIRERALALGGAVELGANTPRGTVLCVRLPITPEVA